jgi:hypothetical protein
MFISLRPPPCKITQLRRNFYPFPVVTGIEKLAALWTLEETLTAVKFRCAIRINTLLKSSVHFTHFNKIPYRFGGIINNGQAFGYRNWLCFA